MFNQCHCHRQYTFFKLLADLFLLFITGGFWVIYIFWRLFRDNRCPYHRTMIW